MDDAIVESLAQQLESTQRVLERVVTGLAGLAGQTDPALLEQGLTELAAEVCGAEFGLFVTIDGDECTGTWVGPRLGDIVQRPAVWRAPLLAEALRGGPQLRIDDVARWTASDAAAGLYGAGGDGRLVRSHLVTPVVGESGELLGALFVGHRRPHAFEAHHERLAQGLATQLGVALSAADRANDRRQVAEALERTLLPPVLPDIGGVEVAARYRPAGEESLVGGDFYDVFRAADDSWAVVLGDVCGFGPEAAAITGLARYTTRAVARVERSPATVLAALNDALVNRNDGRFVTAVELSLVEARDHLAVTLACAGHPPPLLLHDDGTVELVDAPGGTVLGVFPDAGLAETKLELEPGDSLVLYTDGVVEARAPDGEFYGDDRLVELLGSCGGRTADGIARRIDLSVFDFLAGHPRDDVAIVVVQARPTGPTRAL